MGTSTSKSQFVSQTATGNRTGETRRPALCFQSFPSDWAWTMIFLKLSFLFSWSRPANCHIHCFIEENWKHDVLNSGGVQLAGAGTPKSREETLSVAQVCPSLGRILGMKTKCKGLPHSNYVKAIRCPTTVCRINKQLKKRRAGRREERSQGRSNWTLALWLCSFAAGHCQHRAHVFPFLHMFISYQFLWPASLGHKVMKYRSITASK